MTKDVLTRPERFFVNTGKVFALFSLTPNLRRVIEKVESKMVQERLDRRSTAPAQKKIQ